MKIGWPAATDLNGRRGLTRMATHSLRFGKRRIQTAQKAFVAICRIRGRLSFFGSPLNYIA